MADSTIETFLKSNSSLSPQAVANGVVRTTMKSKYRPDKIFDRNELMKWNMIYNGIDTPHRMSNRAVFVKVDPTWLVTELDGLEEFKI